MGFIVRLPWGVSCAGALTPFKKGGGALADRRFWKHGGVALQKVAARGIVLRRLPPRQLVAARLQQAPHHDSLSRNSPQARVRA